MNRKEIVVLGGGFAGLWAAVGAARKLDELGVGPEKVGVTLVNATPYHNIRVRNYEADLRDVCVPLDDVLGPVNVSRVLGLVSGVDTDNHTVSVRGAAGNNQLPYDRLVFALGSQVNRPQIPGMERAFDVDTYAGAARLAEHLQGVSQQPKDCGVLVVGGGLTGVETAAEMPGRLRALGVEGRVILADHQPKVGSDMGDEARVVIEQALASLGVELRLGVRIAAIAPDGVVLDSGEKIATKAVVWCAGMRANPLTGVFGTALDRLGRLAVDEYMRVKGVVGVFAAGDSAVAMMDETHPSVMSCQHGRPMGRFAGHNVVCDLFGQSMLPLSIPHYVTVLDLGPAGAVYTEGWERKVISQGEAAKRTKQTINQRRIYPPLTGDRTRILAAAAPVVQLPPEV